MRIIIWIIAFDTKNGVLSWNFFEMYHYAQIKTPKAVMFSWNNTDYFCFNTSKALSTNRFFFFFQTLPVDDMRIWRKNKIHKMNILISSNSSGGGDSTNVLQHRQISSTTRPNTIMRTPDHYEMIDQIGKGEITYNILFS